ncbi:unnamed protein product [Cylindrotheca closterium]|uniref:WSC domain-containing protein n=1 Tax=Cylindrotheca closterium TaxID=2856 RepID=A0AAD2FP86_9STRA|nr:unnamed protein product [Cylindrotheca closterium]
MLSSAKSLLLALCLALVATSTIGQFTDVGNGVCVDGSGSQFDYVERAGVASTAACQTTCSSIDTTNLRGLEYESTTRGCLCLYENGAGVPANAFAEGGVEPGGGAVAGANSTFATFTCYSFSGGSYTNRGVGGCVDSRANFYSYGVPFNARGSQTLGTCQNACTAAGTSGLVGLDYDGECYCLYSEGSQPTVFFNNAVSSNSGSGTIGRTNTMAGVTCQRFGTAIPVSAPIAVPVAVPVAQVPVTVPVSVPVTVTVPVTVPVAAPVVPAVPVTPGAKAPKVKGSGKKGGAKAPTTNRGSKLVASPSTSTVVNPKAPKIAKRRARY